MRNNKTIGALVFAAACFAQDYKLALDNNGAPWFTSSSFIASFLKQQACDVLEAARAVVPTVRRARRSYIQEQAAAIEKALTEDNIYTCLTDIVKTCYEIEQASIYLLGR